jgi:hypothetical protein
MLADIVHLEDLTVIGARGGSALFDSIDIRCNSYVLGWKPMHRLSDFPRVLFVVSLAVLWLSAQFGFSLRKWLRPVAEDERADFDIVLTAALTLLSLIIGFSFSMAVGRYDQRKDYEAAEANAIGTEYLRSDLLGPPDAKRVQDLLKKYIALRVQFYTVQDARQLSEVNADTAQLQQQMWAVVQGATAAKPSLVTALVASGMNDVLNSQGYTQAAWWNRIPTAAWSLMAAIAVGCNLLLGYEVRRRIAFLLTVLPLVLSVAFLLIAEIDSPRGGVIKIRPENLISLSQSLSPR